MSTGDWSESDEPEIGARCLKLCREVIWNANDPEAPYTLRGVIQSLRPRTGYPTYLAQPVHLYAEFFGEAGERDVWFDLVRLVFDADGDLADEVEETVFGPFSLNLTPNLFVQGRWYVLRRVPFPAAGLYEFRLRIAGVSAPLIAERVQLEE
jgi:hypothetical protein